MKTQKCLLCVFLLLGTCSFAKTQTLSQLDVLKFEIVRVLSELKLAPKMGMNNVVKFTYEGGTFVFEYSEEENLFYGCVSRQMNYSDRIKADDIDHFNADYNYKTVKIVDNGTGFMLKSEFFFDDKATLKAVFPQLLQSMSRAWKSLKKNAANYKRDSLLVIKSIEPVMMLADSTKAVTSVVAMASIETNYPGNYVVGLRLYQNNCLLSCADEYADFTRLDTLLLDKTISSVKLSAYAVDSVCPDDRFRYEVWYKGQCAASENVTNLINK